MAVGLHNVGLVLLALERWDEAGPVLRESLAAAVALGYKESIVYTLESLAVLDTAVGDPARAVLLLGAAGELAAEIGMTLAEPEASMHERTVAAARAALGEEFDVLWSRGRELGLETALACATEISVANAVN